MWTYSVFTVIVQISYKSIPTFLIGVFYNNVTVHFATKLFVRFDDKTALRLFVSHKYLFLSIPSLLFLCKQTMLDSIVSPIILSS